MASKPQERPLNIDIDAVRERLTEYKQQANVSWGDLGARMGIAAGTLSNFGIAKYDGNNAKIATDIVRYFEAEANQAKLRQKMKMEVPDFQLTRAARETLHLMQWARRGNMVAVASSPGFGKTSTLRQFQADTPQVWVATMAPSTAGVPTMLTTILAAMGDPDARGTPQTLSRRIREKVRATGGVIALDDAQHVSVKALDELRGIHDVTGVGIVLLGNAGLLQALEGGSRSIDHAQIFSRLSLRIVRNLAYAEDGILLGRAWGIEDEKMLHWLGKLTLKPGGLRGVTFTIQLAMMLASLEEQGLTIDHLRDAWAQLSYHPTAN